MSLCSIKEPRKLIDKCIFEIDKLESSKSQQEYDYLIFNCIITLNHLFEWFIKDTNSTSTEIQKCIDNFNPYNHIKNLPRDEKINTAYQKMKNFPELNKYQEAIRKLCNKTKHFENKNIEYEKSETFNIVTSNGDTLVTELGEPIVGIEKSYFIEIDKKEIKIISIIKNLIESWSSFFKSINQF